MRGIQDRLRRAIVLIEDNNPGVREVVLEVEDVADIGAAPGVDGLVRVANYTDVAVMGGPLLGEDVLRDVGVLKFVDVHVQVAVGILLEDILSLIEELDCLEQDVLEKYSDRYLYVHIDEDRKSTRLNSSH